MKCPDCGSEEIEYDQARGDAACFDCGIVLEQNLIVNEVGFSEDARGRSNVVGQHVRADGRINSFGGLRGYSREATELTMQNAKRSLSHMVSSLKLQSRHTESALRLFRLAVEKNFHKGRKMANVCCACLYVVCRLEKTPHMLLDFSDVLETNLYALGHTFLKLTKVLSIQLPVIDPSLYIHRFASKLEFGDDTHVVAMSALRVIARMQRNWLSEGRRPSSLCGAALMISAKMHNYHRTQTDVARIVRIGNVALKERLRELNRTPTATLTIKEIDEGGGDDGKSTSLRPGTGLEAADPPAYQRLIAMKLRKRKRVDISENQTEGTLDKSGAGSDNSHEDRLELAGGAKTADDVRLENEVAEAMASEEFRELDRETVGPRPIDVSAMMRESIKLGKSDYERVQTAMKLGMLEKEVEDEDELSDLDDEDTGKYLNTEEEYERKKDLWTEVNKEYLEKQERLERMKKERPEEYKRLRPSRNSQKKKKATSDAKTSQEPQNDNEDEPASPIDVPKSSKKLNYSVLNALEDSDDDVDVTSPVTSPSRPAVT